MNKYQFLLLGLGCIVFTAPPELFATGGFYADDVLDKGGQAVETAPEFYWADLVTELARNFRPAEKAVVPAVSSEDDSGLTTEGNSDPSHAFGPISPEVRSCFTDACDASDYADALKTGRLKVQDASAAKGEHAEQRRVLSALSPSPNSEGTGSPGAVLAPDDSSGVLEKIPEKFANGGDEFDLYNRGAYAYRVGENKAAKKYWQELVTLKPARRHYRSTWANYMLGRLAMREGEWAAAVDYFVRVRALAADGFKDSLGLAAESYGWQAKCELEMGDKDAASKLYLTQLALGDGSAIDSLKKCLPTKRPEDERSDGYFDPDALAGAALDPTRRQLVTAFVLSHLSSPYYYGSGSDAKDPESWLDILEKHGLSLGRKAGWAAWIAYSNGNYEQAARWAALSSEDDAPSQWVRAKLAARKGDFQQAAALLEKVRASRWLKEYELSAGDSIPKYASFYALQPHSFDGNWVKDWPRTIKAELGALLLASGRFAEAERLLRLSGNSRGASYVRENIFTVHQHIAWLRESQKLDLKQLFPDSIFGWTEGEPTQEEINARLAENRSEVGRRLAREARFQEAKAYFSAKERKQLETYEKVLLRGEEKNLPAAELAYRKYAAARVTAEARGGFGWDGEDGARPILATSGAYLYGRLQFYPRPGILAERARSEYLLEGRFYRMLKEAGESNGAAEQADSSEPTFLPLFIKVGHAEHGRLAAKDSSSPLSYHTAKELQLLLKAALLLSKDSAEREEMILAANVVAAFCYAESVDYENWNNLVLALREAKSGLSEEAAVQQLETARQGIDYYDGNLASLWPKGSFDERYRAEHPPDPPQT